MKKFERIITIAMLVVISLSNVATPAAYAAEVALPNMAIPGTDLPKAQYAATPNFATDNGSVLGASTSLLTVGSQSLDLTQDTAASAHKRIPVQMQKLTKKVYRSDEDVTLAVTNPDNEAFVTTVQDSAGEPVSVPLTETNNGNTTTVDLAASDIIKPGKYTVVVTDQNGKNSSQDFTWGVLALNTDKSLYHPNETADISMAVLNDQGDMVCDARLELTITNKALGITDDLSTRVEGSNQIIVSPQCQKHDFSLQPDYEAHYKFHGAGTYQLQLTGITTNGIHTITDEIQVKDVIPFDVQRVSATRIYPPNSYPMTFNITANRDFTGTVTETVPDSFTITPATDSATTVSSYNTMSTVYLNANDPAVQMEQAIGASTSGGLNMPFHGKFPITQGFGAQLTDPTLQAFYTHYGLAGHDGIDFGVPMNTPLYAVDGGTVIWSGPGDYGTMVTLQHAWGETYYGHMTNPVVSVGQTVTKGQLIGYSGMSGEATGPHLHFGMKPLKPDMTNGYYGKVDPMPYLPIGQGEPIAALGGSTNPIADALNNTAILGASDSAATPTPSDIPAISPTTLAPTSGLSTTTTPTPSTSSDSSASQSALPSVIPSPTAQPEKITTIGKSNIAPANTNISVLQKQILLDEQIANSALTEKVKMISWHVSLKKGQSTSLGYDFQGPHVSPQFYLLGPMHFYNSHGQDIFQEQRQWQIASDDVGIEWYQNTSGSNFNGYSWQYRKKLTIDHTKVNSGAVSYDATGPTTSTNESATSPLAWTHTVSGSNTALLVGVAVGGTDTGMSISATDNSKKMILLRMVHSDEVDGSTSGFIAVFGLINPPSGSNSISVSVSGGTLNSMTGASESFTGVSGFGQAVGNSGDTTGTGANGSVTLNNTTSGNIIAGFICNGSNVNNAIAPSTDRYIDNDTSSNGCGTFGASSTNATGSSQTISWSMASDFWAAVGVEVLGQGTALPTATFMDSGGDATKDTTSELGFWTGSLGSPTVDNSISETGPESLKFNTGTAPGVEADVWANNTIQDSGTRTSQYVNITNYPSTAWDIICACTSGGTTAVLQVNLSTSGQLSVTNNSGTQIGSSGSTLSTGTWYRIAFSYVVTSTTNYSFKVYVNGTQDISYSQSSGGTALSTTGSNAYDVGWGEPSMGANKVMNVDDIYVDSGNDNSDPGTIHVTAKLPISNGASNSFTTNGSANGTACTTGTHCQYVNERALSTTDYLSATHGTSPDNFTLQGASTGDVDISTFNPIANQSWVYERQEQSGCTVPYYYFNGDKILLSLTTSAAMYSSIQNNPYYPSSNTAVGATSCTNASGTHTVDLYETGMQIAYTTLTPVTSSLTNFPVLVSLSGDSDLSTYAQSSCNDVVFTDSTGRTKLNFNFDLPTLPTDCSSGNLKAWVQVPTLSANTDTIIYMYYGNPSASSQTSTSTWDSNYKGVWHFSEGSSTPTADSTSNPNSGAITSATWTTGEIGNGINFNGTGQRINAGSDSSLDNLTSGLTVEAWVERTTSSGANDRTIVNKADSSSFNTGWVFYYDANTGQLGLKASFNGASDLDQFSSGNVVTLNSWVHVVATWTGSTSESSVHLYANGAEVGYGVGGDAVGSYLTDASNNLYMGQFSDSTAGVNLIGNLDEVRVSNTVRSAGWIQTEYNSESSPGPGGGGFISALGSVETNIYAPQLSEVLGHGDWFDSTGTKQPFVF